MKLRPFSEHARGVFVSVDGPSGAGKSTIVHHLAQLLVATVISDRYIPSGLVMQRFDGIDPVFLWRLNAEVDRPDLAVILEADPEVISERLVERGPHNRFQLSPGSSHAEVHFYRQATERLIQAGFDVLKVDCNQGPPEQSAAFIRDCLMTFFTSSTE
ncbi:MAG: dTMP kinase [Pseudonocardiaceae bacterium]